MKKKANKIPRRLLTVTMSCMFIISLSSCSGAKNSYGNLNHDEVYAQSGKYSVTNGDLWNELKWNASSQLGTQIENVILNDQITKITLVMNHIGKYDELSDDEKAKFNNSKEEFERLEKKYQDRLVDYVVQDIYNLTYSNDSYWDSVEDFDDTNKEILETQYIDEIYTTYMTGTLDGKSMTDLVSNGNKDNADNYLTIATNLSELYYPLYAKELFAEEKITEEVIEGNADDDDLEDSMLGYFSNSNYVSKFKSEYANTHTLNMVLIRFKTTDEFNDTLRAFGLKLYNNNYYFLGDDAIIEANDLDSTEALSYADYCNYYDDWTNSNLTSNYIVEDKYMLEVFIQIYNYLYGGYRTPLASGIESIESATVLNHLRGITNAILNETADSVYDTAVASLKENNSADTTFTKEALDEINTTFATYLYETLDLEGTSFSTSSQNYNNGYYVAYKFGEGEKSTDIYNKDLTDDEIIDIILGNTADDSTYGNVKEHLQDLLIRDRITDTTLTSYLTAEQENIRVKIYDEATEISYMRENTTYSKTLSGTKNQNLLATIEYNDVLWNMNIVSDKDDANSLLVPGKTGDDRAYGVYNTLEKQYGQTTALDLLSNQIIKDTEAYINTNDDRDLYNDYIESILYNFANDGYASSGYSSSIGKYNFLMLYFHSANIDDIIDNFYRVQAASSQLLTDYSNSNLLNLFKTYADRAYDTYFSLEASRLVVSFDGDDDGESDDLSTWPSEPVTFEGKQVSLTVVAKQLIYDMYSELEASTESHSTKLESLVEEYNGSARVAFDETNPVPAENKWAKYRKLGLTVEIIEFTATNSSTDIDFELKTRLYEYSKPDGDYQYFKNGTTPTIYIEPLSEDAISADNDQIIGTKDGYNLILVTTGSDKPSAELDMEDYDDLIENITLKYNEKYFTIDSIANDSEKLTENQIKLYVLEYVTSQTSNLTPSSLSSAVSTFLSPVITRFTGDATQREIILQYINNASEAGAINFEINGNNAGYNEIFKNITLINKKSADNYIDLYKDPTGTADSFSGWWENLGEYLSKEAK